MFSSDRSAFSPEGDDFAYCFTDVKLIVKDTTSNSVKHEYSFNSNEYGACSCLIWVPCKRTINTAKKARLTKRKKSSLDDFFLVIGTERGQIVLFNYITTTPTNLANEHSVKVNDLCWNSVTESLFSCYNDGSVAVWDVCTRKIKLKWKASDDPVFSICLIDSNNLLTANKTILWWNIEEQTIIKKFSSQPAEILKLVPVSAEEGTLDCLYILSAAAGENKINAWNINENSRKNPVATFVLNDEPKLIEVSKLSKDKPLLLSVLTKDGCVHLFEHVFNGKRENNLQPKTTIKLSCKSSNVDSQLHPVPIISVKLTQDLETCIIAYGSQSNPVFEYLNIVNSPKDMVLVRENCGIHFEASKSKSKGNSKVNGSFSFDENASSLQLTVDGYHKSHRRKEAPSDRSEAESSIAIKALTPLKHHQYKVCPKLELAKNTCASEDEIHYSSESDSGICSRENTVCRPGNVLKNLVCGLEARNEVLVNTVLDCADAAEITETLRHLPSQNIKLLLEYLHQRLKMERTVPSVRKWLKELLRIHLNHINSSNNFANIVNPLKELIKSKKPTETISKISTLQGLLSLHLLQTSSSDSEESSDEMES